MTETFRNRTGSKVATLTRTFDRSTRRYYLTLERHGRLRSSIRTHRVPTKVAAMALAREWVAA